MKKWAIISLIAMLMLSGYTFSNIYIRQHQDLPHQTIIVNSLVYNDIESNNTKEINSINDANINNTTILKTGDNIADSPKSKVVIKIYKKTVEFPEFPELEKVITMSIIIIVATIKLLVMKND